MNKRQRRRQCAAPSPPVGAAGSPSAFRNILLDTCRESNQKRLLGLMLLFGWFVSSFLALDEPDFTIVSLAPAPNPSPSLSEPPPSQSTSDANADQAPPPSKSSASNQASPPSKSSTSNSDQPRNRTPPPIPNHGDRGNGGGQFSNDNDDDDDGPKHRLHRFASQTFKLAVASICAFGFVVLVLAFLRALLDVGWKSMKASCAQASNQETEEQATGETEKSDEMMGTGLLTSSPSPNGRSTVVQ